MLVITIKYDESGEGGGHYDTHILKETVARDLERFLQGPEILSVSIRSAPDESVIWVDPPPGQEGQELRPWRRAVKP